MKDGKSRPHTQRFNIVQSYVQTLSEFWIDALAEQPTISYE